MKKHWSVHDGDGLRTFSKRAEAEDFALRLANGEPGSEFIVLEAVACYVAEVKPAVSVEMQGD